MVKIRRGEHETMVSMASYENIFKPLGYDLVEDNKVEIPKKEKIPEKVELSKKEEIPEKIEIPKTTETKRKKK